MEYREPVSPAEQIKDLSYFIDKERLIIRWLWPCGADSVYIYKASETEGNISIHHIARENSKLYTKDEYKEFYGYCKTIDFIEKSTYWIFPCIRENGKLLLINQNGVDNKISISTGKANIYYSLKEKRRIFGDIKTVIMTLVCDAPVKKDALCYVIKSGGNPINKEDGKSCSFNQDFEMGVNELPEIEIRKDDHVRIFFEDGRKYGEIYELIRR